MISAFASVVWFALLCVGDAQIRVMSPQWLEANFPDHGKIQGSTSTFGAPFFGDDVIGKLVYGESTSGHEHCTVDDYSLPDQDQEAAPEAALRGSSENAEARLINIVVVRRGKCSFTQKVKVAYQKGAHAVIVVDKEDSDLTSQDLQNVIVADDGYGGEIHIPSILISKQDGAALIEAVSKTTVTVQLSWDIPQDHVVSMDLWMSSGSSDSLQFLKEFSEKRKTLNEVMRFQPHYAVFSMASSDPAVYQGLCSDTTGNFCAEDPDTAGDITGKDVLEEDVRQLCIHELTKKSRSTESRSKAPAVEYAEEYWNYVKQFESACPLAGNSPHAKFGTECSEKLMQKVGLDMDQVRKCVISTQDEKLRKERDNSAWSPRALRINGWRYTGMMDSDLVTRAVCAGFTSKPKECQDLIAPRNPFEVYAGSTQNGISISMFVGGLVSLAVLLCLTLLCYRRRLKVNIQHSIREEVMLEVQTQMASYSKLGGEL